MYLEFLETLSKYVRALNEVSESIEETEGLTPYVQFIPVLVDRDLCGFLSDEVGNSYEYHEATDAQREWWAARPR